MRKALMALAVLLIAACAALGLAGVELARPFVKAGGVIVDVPGGATVRGIARLLEEKNVVSSALLFEYEARFRAKGHIRAGEYLFPEGASIRDAVRILVEGKVVLHPLTIPEGLNLGQIARRAEEEGFATADDFINAASGRGVLDRWGIPADDAEGYLFPETYHFPKNTPAAKIVSAMIGMFFSQAKKAIPEDVMADPGKLRHLVTLASLVEKETALDREKELVAAVFTNRLAKDMPLQCDPTVIYALPDYDGNLRKEDLSYDSPYNTYRYTGLPPGPIASPGLASIAAAYRPAPVDYLYFVSNNRGEHVFSKTLSEHNRAVRRYQIASGG